MIPPRYHTQRGFSLVELSIVLVILGLLVGGVLGGQALIRAAEIRGVLADKDKYLAAVYTFKNKYQALTNSFRGYISVTTDPIAFPKSVNW